MKKCEVKKELDSIKYMNDEDIKINPDFIRKIATESYALITNLERSLYKKKRR